MDVEVNIETTNETKIGMKSETKSGTKHFFHALFPLGWDNK